MLCLISKQNDVYFNLASEEYFLKNTDDELFILYINNPTIVAGKHQNILGEINTTWTRNHNVTLARRITGGGTVYQDHGNLNFSFISNCPNLEEISYKRFTLPIVLTLKSLGINVEFSGRNDLILDNKKISGNAMHIYRKRVLSHGTLLFKTELKNLTSALQNNPHKYIDRSIKSVRSSVVNISEYLPKAMTMNEFTNIVFMETCKYLKSPNPFKLSESDKSEINKLSQDKYSTWDWILGYSPKYVFLNEIMIGEKLVKFQIEIEKGVIKNYTLENSASTNKDNILIFNSLIDVKHDFQTICEVLSKENFINLVPGFTVENFCDQLF